MLDGPTAEYVAPPSQLNAHLGARYLLTSNPGASSIALTSAPSTSTSRLSSTATPATRDCGDPRQRNALLKNIISTTAHACPRHVQPRDVVARAKRDALDALVRAVVAPAAQLEAARPASVSAGGAEGPVRQLRWSGRWWRSVGRRRGRRGSGRRPAAAGMTRGRPREETNSSGDGRQRENEVEHGRGHERARMSGMGDHEAGSIRMQSGQVDAWPAPPAPSARSRGD